MASTLGEQMAAAKAALAEHRNATSIAHSENVRISKIPVKSVGGGKGAKKAALEMLDKARRDEAKADEVLRNVEMMWHKQQYPRQSVVAQATEEVVPCMDLAMDGIIEGLGNATANPVTLEKLDNISESTDQMKTKRARYREKNLAVSPDSPPVTSTDTEDNTYPITSESDTTGSPLIARQGAWQSKDDENADDNQLPVYEPKENAKGKAPAGETNDTKVNKGKTPATKTKDDVNSSGNQLDKPETNTNVKRKAKTKTPADEAVRFEDLNDEAKEKLTDQGQKAIDAFISKGKQVPFSIRRLIRDVQVFLPVAATISRELSLHILATNRGNFICLFHQNNRHTKQSDGFGQKHTLIGVPHENMVASTKDGENWDPLAGYMHCGCSVDVALTDFFWWKTWVLTSTIGTVEVSEGLRDGVLETWPRAFFVKAFTEATGLTLDDLYASKVGVLGYTKAVRLYQLRKLVAEINEWNALDGSPLIGLTIDNLDGDKL